MKLRAAYHVAGMFVIAGLSLWAQTGVGSLTGQVVDPAGAAVPGAAVTLHSESTGRDQRTVSSNTGLYSFPTVDVGDYTVTVEATGFKRLARSGLTVLAANRSSLELRLEVGDVTQSVEVSAEAPLLSAATSDLGTNFQPKLMKDAPLFVGGGFRNPENFISYMPGVNNGQQDTSINGGPRRSK